MNPTTALRRASAADAATLAAIQQEASLAGVPHVYPPELYPFPTDAVRERWESYTAAGGWAVLTDGQTPAGFVAVSPPWLEAMYVRPAAWGTGLADVLHAAAVAELRAQDVDRARLWTLEHNGRARRFYERHGWTADGSSRIVEFPPNPIDLGYSLDLP